MSNSWVDLNPPPQYHQWQEKGLLLAQPLYPVWKVRIFFGLLKHIVEWRILIIIMKVGKISDKKKVLQFMFGAPWRCTRHWRNKLMRRFYCSERWIWKEFYWTLCTVRSTNTYDKGVLLWLMSSVLATCEVLCLPTNLYSASRHSDSLGQSRSLMKRFCPTQRDIELQVAIHYVRDVDVFVA